MSGFFSAICDSGVVLRVSDALQSSSTTTTAPRKTEGTAFCKPDRVAAAAGRTGRRRSRWTNATNSALRLNFEAGEPVRVVRGPKLLGAHGTADTRRRLPL